MKKYIVDRFEGEFAVLEKADGTTIDVTKSEIPNAKEGDVIIFNDGAYIIDEAETQKRKEMIAEKMKKLFGRK